MFCILVGLIARTAAGAYCRYRSAIWLTCCIAQLGLTVDLIKVPQGDEPKQDWSGLDLRSVRPILLF